MIALSEWDRSKAYEKFPNIRFNSDLGSIMDLAR